MQALHSSSKRARIETATKSGPPWRLRSVGQSVSQSVQFGTDAAASDDALCVRIYAVELCDLIKGSIPAACVATLVHLGFRQRVLAQLERVSGIREGWATAGTSG